MMSKFTGFLCLWILYMCLPIWANTPVGMWKTIDDKTGETKSYVRIWEDKGILYGKIDSLFSKPGEDPNRLCTQCEGKNKNKPVKGLTIMWDLKKDDDEWNGGQILDPKNGKVYRCKMKLDDTGRKLAVRGFLGISLLGRSQEWIRIE